MRNKLLCALALVATILLSGCAANAVTSSSETTEDGSTKAEYVDVSTTCGLYYKEFLKFGSLASEDVSAENPDCEYTEDGSKESWEFDGGTAYKFSYWRDSESDMSVYTRTFPINTGNISAWVDVEVIGIDNLLDAVHERSQMNGASWYYTWSTAFENCVLQVYSTGEYGNYVGLVSFTRSGATSVDDLPNGGTVE